MCSEEMALLQLPVISSRFCPLPGEEPGGHADSEREAQDQYAERNRRVEVALRCSVDGPRHSLRNAPKAPREDNRPPEPPP